VVQQVDSDRGDTESEADSGVSEAFWRETCDDEIANTKRHACHLQEESVRLKAYLELLPRFAIGGPGTACRRGQEEAREQADDIRQEVIGRIEGCLNALHEHVESVRGSFVACEKAAEA